MLNTVNDLIVRGDLNGAEFRAEPRPRQRRLSCCHQLVIVLSLCLRAKIIASKILLTDLDWKVQKRDLAKREREERAMFVGEGKVRIADLPDHTDLMSVPQQSSVRTFTRRR